MITLSESIGCVEYNRNQLITRKPTIIPACLIIYDTIVTAPFVGVRKQSTPNNNFFCHIVLGNPGTRTHIVVRHSSRVPL